MGCPGFRALQGQRAREAFRCTAGWSNQQPHGQRRRECPSSSRGCAPRHLPFTLATRCSRRAAGKPCSPLRPLGQHTSDRVAFPGLDTGGLRSGCQRGCGRAPVCRLLVAASSRWCSWSLPGPGPAPARGSAALLTHSPPAAITWGVGVHV